MQRPLIPPRSPRFLLIPVCILLMAVGLEAAEVRIFRTDTREAFLQGEAEGVAVGPLGSLELARRIERRATIEEPFVFCAAAHPEGWVVGTGNSGRVLKVTADGRVEELFAAAEPEIFAVWADPDGTVVAASSPHGKVYRIAGERVEVVFEPPAAYLWALARDRRGRLLVATGLPGHLYRIDRGGHPELLLAAGDRHLRALAVLPDGSLLAGTAGQGRILRLPPGGPPETLHDAAQPEILAFAVRPEGGAFAVALASEASFVDLARTQVPDAKGEGQGEGDGTAQVTVAVRGQGTVGSRTSGYAGPRSTILEIAPDGRVEERVSFQEETVHAIAWQAGELWIGTGQEGLLYRHPKAGLVRERQLPERQIVALAPGPEAAVVTTNGGALYRLPDGREEEGTYTSAILDAGQVARFGSYRWQGELPPATAVALALRSGMSLEPDATWTDWQDAGTGRELALGELAAGRYVQWRATLRGGGEASPHLRSAELSYRQENLRPAIDRLEVLDPGEILVPAGFNPQDQTFEPWSPNRDGIFTTLRAAAAEENHLKTLWKKGYRTLRWTATDGNDDELVYALGFRREGSEGAWLAIVSELDQSHYSFDSTVLADGVYRFRLTASDRPALRAEGALEGEKVSEPVVVDHTPPRLVSIDRHSEAIEVVIEDALSPLHDVVCSVDADEWQPVAPADGLLDGRREVLRLTVPAEAQMVLLRVTDAAWNVVSFDLATNSP